MPASPILESIERILKRFSVDINYRSQSASKLTNIVTILTSITLAGE